MKVRALRGVCVGPERHLVPGETADLDPATGKFLISISAVEEDTGSPPPAPAEEPIPETPAEEPDTDQKSAPAKSGKKEK